MTYDPQKKPFHVKPEHERESIIRAYMAKGQIRCVFCGKMFFPGHLGSGTSIAPKCPRCKEINKITVL